MGSNRFFDLNIQSLSNETEDSTRVALTIPADKRDDFVFKPGQYINVNFQKGNASYLRTYSICSGEREANLEFAAKHIENGVFSGFIKEKKIGDKLKISRPAGNFVISEKKSSCLLLIAAGSGITPIISIAKSFLGADQQNKIILLFCNKKSENMMFRKDIQDLKDLYISRFLVFNFFTQEYQETEFLNGRIDISKIKFLSQKNIISVEHVNEVLICGPIDMINMLSRSLVSVGFKKKQIKFETFFVENAVPVKEKLVHQANDGKNSAIEIRFDGIRKFISLKEGDSFIDTAKSGGINLPFACRNGMCATCRCKVISGRVRMRQNYSLEEWELEEGYILSCQLETTDDKVVLEFDNI